MRPRRRLDEAEADALKASVRKAFTAEEQRRDLEHEAIVSRLLKNLDEFSGGQDGRPAA